MAPTGVAAAALGGTTLHAAIGLSIHANVLPGHLRVPNSDMTDKWKGVLGVIIDELSMIGTYECEILTWNGNTDTLFT